MSDEESFSTLHECSESADGASINQPNKNDENTRKRLISSVDTEDDTIESIDDIVIYGLTDVVVPVNVFDDHEEKRNKLTWTPEMVRTFVTQYTVHY